ncbi:hypothetical protein [Ralstonia holmesii]|uniref:hypothetical protein n=1 Tax=Ralstonia holmesii TaxID=3058602 RepID=UPI0028F4E9EA|nr:hypothetical protein [Ralstonia sp. LMG 32967]CAJ0698787.1 hypothetical protein R11007_02887 [Ralstonia sp. LMG 32967]
MSKNDNDAPKRGAGAAKAEKQEPSLFQQLEQLTKAAMADSDHAAHAALHGALMALAAAKVAAGHAEQATLSDDARALLERIKAL